MKEKEDTLVNVFGCFRCKKLAGDLRAEHVTQTVRGYEQCPICSGDLDYFWLNLTWMKFQESRQVSLEEANRLADIIGKDLFVEKA